MVYLVDSAGARITDQVQMFPGRRGAGRIFYNEVRLSGRVPQVCVLFGPSAAGRRLHPGVLRRGDHARGQRLDVPGLAADGRDGDRREGDARGDGRGEDAHLGLGLRPLPGRLGRGGDRPREALPLLLAVELARGAALGAAGRARSRAGRSPRSCPPTRTPPSTSIDLIDALVDAGSLARGPRSLGQGAGGRLRAARRPRDRHRRQPAEGEGRRAVRRLRRQGGALHLDLQRLQRPAALPRRRARVHDRHQGRAPGDHPPRREDDLRRLRGDGAEDLGGRPQVLRRRPLRDGRARRSSPTAASRCRPPRSP